MTTTLDFLSELLPDLGGGIVAELRHYDQPGAWQSDWCDSPAGLLKTALQRSQEGREVYLANTPNAKGLLARRQRSVLASC